jgi:hypothetical protein
MFVSCSLKGLQICWRHGLASQRVSGFLWRPPFFCDYTPVFCCICFRFVFLFWGTACWVRFWMYVLSRRQVGYRILFFLLVCLVLGLVFLGIIALWELESLHFTS